MSYTLPALTPLQLNILIGAVDLELDAHENALEQDLPDSDRAETIQAADNCRVLLGTLREVYTGKHPHQIRTTHTGSGWNGEYTEVSYTRELTELEQADVVHWYAYQGTTPDRLDWRDAQTLWVWAQPVKLNA